jgi:hypothetical protein
MTKKPESEPEFLKELELEAPELASLPLEHLSSWSRRLPRPRASKRLLAEVRVPLCYAPFFDALASLWDLSETACVPNSRAKDGEWRLRRSRDSLVRRARRRRDSERKRPARSFAPGFRFPSPSQG